MVRSKEVPKKPRDALLTPPSKRRGSLRDEDRGGGGSLPWHRAGVAMSPAPASVPNYMRGTNSSGQRAVVPSSASASPARRRPVRMAVRGKVLFPDAPGVSRATCSSSMKEAKFPAALDLAPGATDGEGPAAVRVCPYTYCSLNGHAHAPAVPLRSFLASRRQLIKSQQSMKLKGVSAFRGGAGHQRPEGKNGGCVKIAPLIGEEALGDGEYFVEVYTGPRLSSDMSCSDMSLDEMDAPVRRMEFVVFDRCGEDDDDDNTKLNDLGDGRLETRFAVCRDSSSECSDSAISGNLLEEFSWLRYQGYEYDSLDDEVSEEQGHGVEDEEIHGFKVSDEQEGKDEVGTSGKWGAERKEETDEELEPKDDDSISDLPSEKGIITDVVAKMYITAEQTEEEKLLDGVHKFEIPKYEVVGRVENIMEDGCKEDNSVNQEVRFDVTNVESTGKLRVTEEVGAMYEEHILDDGSDMETSETVSCVEHKEDFSEKEVTSEAVSEGEISEFSPIGSPDVEVVMQPTNGGFEQDVDTVEDAFEQHDIPTENTVGGTKDVQKELEITTGKLEDASEESGIAQESSNDVNFLCVDAAAEMEPEITKCKPEGEISEFSPSSSPDVGVVMQPTIGGFEQDVDTVEDAFEQNDIPTENTVSGTRDVQKELEITTGKLEDASEESGIAQESSNNVNFLCVDAAAEMEPEITKCKSEGEISEFSPIGPPDVEIVKQPTNGGFEQDVDTVEDAFKQHDIPTENTVGLTKDAQYELEIATCKLEDASEEPGITQQSSNGVNSLCVDAAAEMEPEITKCKSEDSSEESRIAQEISQHDRSAYVTDDTQYTTCKLGHACDESGIGQETFHDGNPAYEGAQVQLGVDPSELGDTSEECGITHDFFEASNSTFGSDDAPRDPRITTCKLRDASEEFVTLQEADQDHNSTDIRGDAQNESCELAYASEESDITQEATRDDNTGDVNDGVQKESRIIASESEYACDESNITQECDDGDYTAGTKKESEITCEVEDGCDDVSINEEANLSPIVKLVEHNYDFSATSGYEEPQDVSAKDTDKKEFSIDDMCNVFCEMNLTGDVYIDPTESASCPRNRLIIARRRRTPEEEEYMRGFNPRAPNFLPLELDPDAEKVDLKHQMTEDRKNAEEWMIDYALRRAVNNLGPARKKKVELLVQAFETVLPHDEDGKKNITPTRSVQACN